jgi:hypothetical protein
MAGPMPGLLTLMEELYGRINKERLFGGGVRGAATRGLLGADAPPNATPAEMEAYRNIANASMALAAGPVAAIKATKGTKAAKTLKDAPRAEAMETARQNAVRMLGLPENNTPEMRARAMGFDTEAYHGTTKTFQEFDKAKRGTSTDPGWYGPGEYSTPYPSSAEAYIMSSWPDYKEGANIIPLLVRNPEKITNKFGNVTEYVTRNPNQLRSRFAAFDPARIKDKDLLASLAAMGITLPLTMGLLSEQTD